MKKGLITPKAYKKWQSGHPWLTADDLIRRNDLPERPSLIFFGDSWWFCSPKSFLRLRRFGPQQLDWMKNPRLERITNADQFRAYFGDWLKLHLGETLKRKMQAVLKGDDDIILRWIFSETDLLPGLTVDVFKDTLVCQLATAPIETFWFSIRELLTHVFEDQFDKHPRIVELRNSPARKMEGLEVIQPVAEPTTGETRAAKDILRWNGYKWRFQLHPPRQKTGAYLDQRENHRRTAELAQQFNLKTAWDVFCYQGGFTLPLIDKGLNVTAVDQSHEALELLKENIGLNGLPLQRAEIVEADAFEWLNEQRKLGRRADLIILDPPSFVRSRETLPAARKGYIELNRLALECLTPNGLLVSCVCSHHMRPDDYRNVIETAADSNTIQILEKHGPSVDHSPLAGFPESNYLQAWFVQRVVDSK